MKGHRMANPLSTRHSLNSSIEQDFPYSHIQEPDPALCAFKKSSCLPCIHRKNRHCSIVTIDEPIDRSSRATSMFKNRQKFHESQSLKEDPVLTPAQVFKAFKHNLNMLETKELFEYPQIYFVGKISTHKLTAVHTYDDENGEYSFIIGDHLSYRYEILKIIGKGTFGQVLKCYDHKDKELVAIKLIKNNRLFLKQAALEVKVLKFISKNANEDKKFLLQYKECFFFREHLCISFELLSLNLYEYLQLNSYNGLDLKIVQSITLQLLTGLLFLHKNKIIHCDLKPENIALIDPTRSAIKIIDFGSASLEEKPSFSYIQTRYYRAPEVMFGIEYNDKIDIWSLGCIVVEMACGVPIFAGRDEAEQIDCIKRVIGMPPIEMVKKARRNKEAIERVCETICCKVQDTIRQDPLLYEFIMSKYYIECLEWEPEVRMSTEEALRHPWVRYKYS